MAIDTISILPDAPSRTSAPATFNTTAEAFVAALAGFVTELNTAIGQMNADFSGTNYQGDWSADTGAAAVGDTYSHDGSLWLVLTTIADITLSEPSASNSDFVIIGNSPVGEAVLQTLSGTTPTWTLGNGAAAKITLSGNTAITLGTWPAGTVAAFAFLEVTQDAGASGYTVAFSGTTVETEDSQGLPTLSPAASAVDAFVLYTLDNGTTTFIKRVMRNPG